MTLVTIVPNESILAVLWEVPDGLAMRKSLPDNVRRVLRDFVRCAKFGAPIALALR
jgi:hypothetical protein